MNFRFFLCLAITLVVSTIVSVKLFVSSISKLILLGITTIVLGIVFVVFVKRKKKIFGFVLCMLLCIIIPFVSVLIKSERIKRNNSLNVENCYISGKIYKLDIQLSENRAYLYLSDVSLKSNEKELNFYGNFLVQMNVDNVDTSSFEIGKIITVYGSPTFYSLESNSGVDLSYISRGINAKCLAYSYTFWLNGESSLEFRDEIRNSVYADFKQTDRFYTNIGFAMMFGETSVLENDVYSVFTDTGIAHLLAVSGFHVSIIISFISFVLDKLKTKKGVKFTIIFIILGIYAYICDFSVSVMRASIMSLLLIFANGRNKEYDRLSALSLACCLIVLINPLDVFSVSFVLSFIAVLSIILLMPVLERLFNKIFYPKFASSLSLTFATSVGISVFQIYYFHKLPLLSFVSNLVTVPLVSVLFIFVILSVVFGSIIGVAVPLIEAFGFGIKYILQFNYWVANIGINLYIGNIPAFSMLIALILMFVLSDYVFIKKRSRVIISSILAVSLILLMII